MPEIEKKIRAKPMTIDSKELIKLVYEEIKKDKSGIKYPVFTKTELNMLIYLLFHKEPEFIVWFIKKRDKRAIRELVQQREAQKTGMPLQQSSIYLRKMKFLKEFIGCKFNSAEAARRCGYSQKYAKQIGYKIRRNLY